MRKLKAEAASKFLSKDPIVLGGHTNSAGQNIVFLEHPTLGDESPIFAKIDEIVFNTGFYDLDDMCASHGEYTPHLVNGEIIAQDGMKL